MENETIFVVDEAGQELEMTVLFTVESTVSQKNIVVYFNPEDEDGQVFASIYDEEGNLFAIEDDAEWGFVEEVFNAFIEEQDEEEAVH
jgi:uncharacterized protein YrzB (UPF0473 family)